MIQIELTFVFFGVLVLFSVVRSFFTLAGPVVKVSDDIVWGSLVAPERLL